MELSIVETVKPEGVDLILGQSHFIKTVEDLHEALVGSVPGIRFGLAFCEASDRRLVRSSGTDPDLVALAEQNAVAIAAGHSFVILLGEGAYPVNVLNAVKMVPEVCRVFCATANPVQVIVVATEQGRGILGVVDGASPLGIEGEDGVSWRKEWLRTIGYKL
jgi:adenosine/AMP kinase